jgi:hypothetical protein
MEAFVMVPVETKDPLIYNAGATPVPTGAVVIVPFATGDCETRNFPTLRDGVDDEAADELLTVEDRDPEVEDELGSLDELLLERVPLADGDWDEDELEEELLLESNELVLVDVGLLDIDELSLVDELPVEGLSLARDRDKLLLLLEELVVVVVDVVLFVDVEMEDDNP